MPEWLDYIVAGLGGGAVHGIGDAFLKPMLGAQPVLGTGITLKDIALVFLGKYGSERTKGHTSTALRGMAIIALYKAVYPSFVEPLISGVVKGVGGVAGEGESAGHASRGHASTAEEAALAYVARK